MQPQFGPNALPQEFLAGLCVIVGVVFLVVLTLVILFLFTMQKALSRVSIYNRTMPPGMVWLMLIPCFNVIWTFFIARCVPDSLRNEFRDRGRDDGSDYAKSIGMTVAVLNIVAIPVSVATQVAGPQNQLVANGINLVLLLVRLVFAVIFWVKIAGYSSKLALDDDRPPRERYYDDDDDDDDDRDYPRGGSSGPSPDTFREGDRGRYK